MWFKNIVEFKVIAEINDKTLPSCPSGSDLQLLLPAGGAGVVRRPLTCPLAATNVRMLRRGARNNFSCTITPYINNLPLKMNQFIMDALSPPPTLPMSRARHIRAEILSIQEKNVCRLSPPRPAKQGACVRVGISTRKQLPHRTRNSCQ